MHSRHTSASVYYRAAIIDAATGGEVRALPRKRNLILDAGLDRVAVRKWDECIHYAAAGSGSTVTRRDSGAVTFTRSGSTVTASAGFFVADDVGRLLKLNSGEELRISAYASATSVTVTTSGAIAASPGTVWYVNQTGLDTELRRTNNYGTGGGDNAVTLNTGAGTLTRKRTFIFPAETATVTYREVGWSDFSTPGANLFGRDVLAGAGLTLTAGQQLKVILELVLTLDLLAPETADALAWAGGGAQQQLENIAFDYWFNPSEAGNVTVFVSESSEAFLTPEIVNGAASGRNISGSNWRVQATADAYVAGSHERTFSGYFDLNAGNSAAIRSHGFGWVDYGSVIFPILRVRHAANQAKTSDESLRLDFNHSWGRVLAN